MMLLPKVETVHVVIESPQGVQLKRNTNIVKKYEESLFVSSEATSLSVEATPAEPESECEKNSSPISKYVL